MSIIKVKAFDRELSFIDMPTISAGSEGVDSVEFEFDGDTWTGYSKTCVFFKNRSEYCPEVLDINNIAKIPKTIIENEGIIYFGLCGVKDNTRLTSTILAYSIKNGVYCNDDIEYDEFAKTNFEQLLEECGEIKESQQAINADITDIKGAIEALQTKDAEIDEEINEIAASINTEVSKINTAIDSIHGEVVYNVLDYNVVNDGVTAVAGNLQSLLDTVVEAGGGTIFFPNGTYYFESTVTFASNIKLQGDTNTVFTADKTSGDYSQRTSSFLEIGSLGGDSVTEYNGFSNVEINNIIFDLGGQWSLDNDVLTYKAKYDSSSPAGSFRGFYSYHPIIACHGDDLRVINCTFKNGIYGGYTGNGGTNPHIMDLGGVKNILIEGCTFEPIFATTTGISNWMGINGKDTGSPDPTNFEFIQLDACYGDGGTSVVKGKLDGTICRDVVIRNNKFYGLPDYDWKNVVNNTGDNDQLLINPGVTVLVGDTSVIYDINYSQWRFGKYAAIGTCHEFQNSNYQPQNVEIYDNYFEGSWNSHYCGSKPCVNEAFNAAIEANHKDAQGRLYPIINEKWEPARKFCNGVIYAYPGARGYNVHNNTFKETTPYTENKSTAVFLYGSLAGIVHDNIFIEYGEPLPRGTKTESMSGFTFEAGDAWSSDKKGYYDGPAYCKSSNNIWIKGNSSSTELDFGMGSFNVRKFGARGDGLTDDGWAIQYTIDRCRDVGGGTVYFPKGTYNITRTLFYYSNMTFNFAEGAIIRKMTDTVHNSASPSTFFAPYFETEIAYLDGTDENGVAYGTSGFDSNRYGVENVVFDGGTLSGYSWNGSSVNKDPSSVVLLTCLCKNIKILNMTFDGNSGGHSIEINSSTNVTVRDCTFKNFASNGGNPSENQLGGRYAENLQIDASTCVAVGSRLLIQKDDTAYKAPDGRVYEKWYKYTRDNNLKYSSLGGYFEFTLLPIGDQYFEGQRQDCIEDKLAPDLDNDSQFNYIVHNPGFFQCCHNIEVASCYFENNQDNGCFVSAIGCHTGFGDTGQYAEQDKHSGIKIHDNTFVWASNHYDVDRVNDKNWWRGVIAFGARDYGVWADCYVYNVSIHGNMFYRNRDYLMSNDSTSGTEEKVGYAITANRGGNRYTRENTNLPQTKYKIYGNFYAGINGWENGTSAEIYQQGNSLVVTGGISTAQSSGKVLRI